MITNIILIGIFLILLSFYTYIGRYIQYKNEQSDEHLDWWRNQEYPVFSKAEMDNATKLAAKHGKIANQILMENNEDEKELSKMIRASAFREYYLNQLNFMIERNIQVKLGKSKIADPENTMPHNISDPLATETKVRKEIEEMEERIKKEKVKEEK